MQLCPTGLRMATPNITVNMKLNQPRDKGKLFANKKGLAIVTKHELKLLKWPEKITKCREDFLQKLSRKLVDENFRHSCRKSGSQKSGKKIQTR